MSKPISILTVAVFAGAVALTAATPPPQAATAKSKKTPHAKSAHRSSNGRAGTAVKKPAAPAAKSTTASRRTGHTTAKRTWRAAKAPSRTYHSGQQAPTPDRYKEIQQALARRGYFHGDANGAWGPESASALKQFQRDQNLSGDGKLDSLSLIALGLGPNRTLSAQAAAPAATQP